MMKVVNIKKKFLVKQGYKDFKDWNKKEDHVYIGRNMNFYVPGTIKSKWHNPYSAKKFGLDKCLELYENYLRQSDLMNDLHELKGKTLGCWCKPEKCHGDILIKLYNEKYE